MAVLVETGTRAQRSPAGGPTIWLDTDNAKDAWYDDQAVYKPVSNHLSAQVNFGADASTTTIGVIPANSYVKSVNIIVQTAFNAATTNTISVGIAGTATKYAGATTVAAVGLVAGAAGSTAGTFTSGKGLETAQQTCIATFNQVGTATAGKALVIVEIVPMPAIV
jgi:hypothetical protein